MSRIAMLGTAAFVSIITGCGDGGQVRGPRDGTDIALDVPGDVVTDTGPGDTSDSSAPEVGVVDTIGGGGIDEACLVHSDCASGWCVESAEGYVCTQECTDTCANGWDCKAVRNQQGDVTSLCLPRFARLCVPCLEDFQCGGGSCLTIDGDAMCAPGCDGADDCPQGYTCAADPAGDRPGRFCLPKAGSCACSQAFAGVRRTCTTTNALATCFGVETCDPEVGWVGCDARVAVPEQCDYVDNDCDGDVDEDFKDPAGVYAATSGCGSCETVCDDVLANATQTSCDVTEGIARCAVVSCKPGFNLVNDYVCAPEVGNVCQPCDGPQECLGTGAACTPLEDGTFCTRGCVASCPQGYDCVETVNGKQCVPSSGSCTCDGSDLTLARACTKETTPANPDDPVVSCKGFERCTLTGWGVCEVAEDHCDGTDNDCDGIIDGPFKTDGVYSAVEHCGACEISCVVLQRPNAVPSCDIDGPVATCGIRCTGDAVDVNGESNDGCECLPVPGDDLAGDDLDSNCDGVDGEVDNAIFVAKDGDDDNPGTRELPVRTLAVGITLADAQDLRDVYVATGVYSENVLLAEGVGVFGGYSPDFSEHEVLLYETAIIGVAPDEEHIGAITAIDVGRAGAARATVLDGFTVFGANAGNTPGASSYAVYVRSSGPRLRISKNRVFGGAGGNGVNGVRGVDGANGSDGFNGLSAKNLTANCMVANESPGGHGGVRLCNAIDVSGGNGGKGVCPRYELTPPDLARGQHGKGQTPGFGGAYGWPLMICADETEAGYCVEVSCTTCYLPKATKRFNPANGTNGATGNNGNAGTAGTTAGAIAAGFWLGVSGGTGGAGSNGSGAGGGGSAGGVQVDGNECPGVSDDDVGGSGGGGGAGGCLGTGGTGGGAGGGSFGIFVVAIDTSHTPAVAGNTVVPGRGGNGGVGGSGGVGGAAGKGGTGGQSGEVSGGAFARCALGGADGGNGGAGGHGGGGGGGAGGPSYALYVYMPGAPPIAWRTDNALILGGAGGTGGIGGIAIDGSRSGGAGADGASGATNF